MALKQPNLWMCENVFLCGSGCLRTVSRYVSLTGGPKAFTCITLPAVLNGIVQTAKFLEHMFHAMRVSLPCRWTRYLERHKAKARRLPC